MTRLTVTRVRIPSICFGREESGFPVMSFPDDETRGREAHQNFRRWLKKVRNQPKAKCPNP